MEERILVSEAISEIPIWRKYALSIDEAAKYFRIGENKLRNMVNEDKNAEYILWNGNRAQIKRRVFEEYLNHVNIV